MLLDYCSFSDFSIIDNKSLSILYCGPIVEAKPCTCTNEKNADDTWKLNNLLYLSPDHKHFFHNLSNNYTITQHAHTYDITLSNFPDHYIVDAWMPNRRKLTTVEDFSKIDVFVEHTVDELDFETVALIKSLLNAGFITTCSCSGHNAIALFVVIDVSDDVVLVKLETLIKIVNLQLSFGKLILEYNSKMFIGNKKLVKLHTDCIGENAYKTANEAATIINTIIGG